MEAEFLLHYYYPTIVGIFSLLWRNKFLITLFLYTFWLTEMKSGMMTGIGA